MTRVVVFGAGAVGSVFGGRLAEAGHAVLLVARPEHVRAIRERGLRLEGPRPATVRVEAAAELLRGPPPDALLLTVKAFDLSEAAREAARAFPPVPTLLVQNGLGVEATVRAALLEGGWPKPERFVVRAVHSVPATSVEPGVVRNPGSGELVLPDVPPTDPLAPVVERFARLFRSAGFSVRIEPAFEREVWRKAILNAAINPVTAAHRVLNGALASGPLREEADRLLSEAAEVARAEGFPFTDRELDDDLTRLVGATAGNRSSMLQDVERGRATEVGVISGEILRRGEALGLSLPATREAVRRLSTRARDPLEG